MSSRSDALAARIAAGAEALASFAESLSAEEWATLVPNDNRPVGTIVHHVAIAYPAEVNAVRETAAGKPLVGFTWEMVDGLNAQHAAEHAEVDQREAIALLRQNGNAAAAAIREFSDEMLDQAVTISLNADAPLTTQFFIEDHALRHSYHHLANIKAALRQSM